MTAPRTTVGVVNYSLLYFYYSKNPFFCQEASHEISLLHKKKVVALCNFHKVGKYAKIHTLPLAFPCELCYNTNIMLCEVTMKSVYLFCTKWFFFLTELPLLYFFVLTVDMHDKSTELLGYYPLETVLVLAMLFILVYYFRAVGFSADEIRMYGLFSSREKSLIHEGDTLLLTLRSRRRLRVELFGTDGGNPTLEWLRTEEYEAQEINLFRGKALGTRRTVLRILRFSGVPREVSAPLLFAEGGFSAEYDTVALSCEKKEEVYEVHLRFLTLPE